VLYVLLWLSVVQGFLVNRVLIPMINEAFYCLMEVRKRQDKDQARC
jgi:3-hydroxyacyl-CoA dehydrogenase